MSIAEDEGSPSDAVTETIPMRLSPALKDEIDAWAGKQPDTPSRSEALRRLVKIGLKRKST